MKNIIYLLLLLTLSCRVLLNKQSKETSDNIEPIKSSNTSDKIKTINSIDSMVQYFETNKKGFNSKAVNLNEKLSIDGGATIYKNNDTKVLQSEFYGTIGKSEYLYFYKKNELYYIESIEYNYNQPYYESGFKIIKTEKFNYYFEGGSLLLMKKDGEVINPTESQKTEIEKLKKSGSDLLTKLEE